MLRRLQRRRLHGHLPADAHLSLLKYTGGVDSGFSIGDRRVYPSLNRIDGPDGPVQLEPKVMAVLACLAGRQGEVVAKDELVREVWEGRFVSDDVVWRSIAELRRALGDDARKSSWIQTIPKRGYRLVVPESGAPAATPSPARRLIPRGLLAAAFLLGFGSLALVLLISARRASTPAQTPHRVRLAVLPFENLSGDPSQEWFSDGLTDELISRLGALRPAALGVIGRTSVMSLKHQGGDLARIGRQLGADYLLEGSVRREGERVRITARLIQTSDQTTVWSDRQDMDLWGTLHLQGSFAERVASAVAPRLLPGGGPRPQSPVPATSPAAHDAYLEALWFLNRGTSDDLRKSVAAFEKAVALDPGSARAHAGLADSVHLLTLFGALPPREAYPRAEAEARKALELDPGLADTHATLGSILFRYHRDGPAAETEFHRALTINPSSATAHHDYAWLLVAERRFDEALTEIHAAQSLEPLSVRANADVGWVYFRAGRDGEAIHQMQRTLELEPRFLSARLCLERALVRQGRLADALVNAREGARQEGMSGADLAALPADPRAALRQIAGWRLARLEERAERGWVSPYALAAQYAELGDAGRAFAALDRAFTERDPSLVSADVDPAFDGVRKDPRFTALVSRIGLQRGPRRTSDRGVLHHPATSRRLPPLLLGVSVGGTARERRSHTRRDTIYRITTQLALDLEEMPRELTDADYQRLLDLRSGLRRFLRWSDEQAAAAGLTSAQHQLLLAIRGHRNPEAPALGPTIGDVAAYLLLRHHSAVGLVDRAVKAGLVVRQEDPSDRRVVRLRLTPLGLDLLSLLTSAHFEELERLVPRMLELWP